MTIDAASVYAYHTVDSKVVNTFFMDSEGNRFKQARRASGMKLDDLVRLTGYSISTISGVENDHDTPSDRLRAKLIEVLSINEGWLETGKGQMFVSVPEVSYDAACVRSIVKTINDECDPFGSIIREVNNLWFIYPELASPDFQRTVWETGLNETRTEVTRSDRERRFVNFTLKYRFDVVPKGLPVRVRLTRPDAETLKDIALSEGGERTVRLIMACLPERLRSEAFLKKLAFFSALALNQAAYDLALGDARSQIAAAASESKAEQAKELKDSAGA